MPLAARASGILTIAANACAETRVRLAVADAHVQMRRSGERSTVG
jgi:hypothetical protein